MALTRPIPCVHETPLQRRVRAARRECLLDQSGGRLGAGPRHPSGVGLHPSPLSGRIGPFSLAEKEEVRNRGSETAAAAVLVVARGRADEGEEEKGEGEKVGKEVGHSGSCLSLGTSMGPVS